MNYRSIIAALVAGTALGGCSTQGNISNPTAPQGQSFLRSGVSYAAKGSRAILFVGNAHTVTAYGLAKGNLENTISKNVLTARSILFNSAGDLVVASGGQSIGVYAGKRFAELQSIKTARPRAITLDSQGNLYVLSSAKVTVFEPGMSTPYNPAPLRTISSGIKDAEAFAVDANGNVYVANYAPVQKGGNTVTVYAPNSNILTQTITQGVDRPYSIALDSVGNLYVGNLGSESSSVSVYAEGSLSLVTSITSGIAMPYCLTFDSVGNLYVCNGAEYGVTVYAPGSYSLIRTITVGIGTPVALLVDSNDDLFVANQGSNTVTEYASKGDSPRQTISQGVDFPYSLTLRP